jgi:hypothetical protein
VVTRCSKFEHQPLVRRDRRGGPLAGTLDGVERPDRNAVDPSLAPPTCSVTVSCGLETIDLREDLVGPVSIPDRTILTILAGLRG